MIYAIIAAGEGSRLTQEGIDAPKPLVKVCGEHLIDRLIRIFMSNDADKIVVICNDLTTLVCKHLEDIKNKGLDGKQVPLEYIVKTTPSSMHSFFELSRLLGDSPFVLTTVDTIFREEEFCNYLSEFKLNLSLGYDGLMGVTDFIDDEKPLFVETDENNKISGFLDSDNGNCKFISGGIYGLNNKAIDTLKDCMNRGESRMRNFQRGLIRDGRILNAFCFSKVLDIDHASDIFKAELFLTNNA